MDHINAYIIRDYIRGVTVRSRILSGVNTCQLCRFVMYQKKIHLRPDTVYIADAKNITDAILISGHGCLLLSGPPSESLLARNLDIIYTEERVELSALVNALSELFFSFHEWGGKLVSTFGSADPLQELGDLCLPYFRNPIGLYTRSFYIMRYHEKPMPGVTPCFIPSDRENYHTDNTINLLLLDRNFEKTWETTLPHIFQGETADDRCLYQNIKTEGQNLLRLVVCEYYSPIADSDYALLSFVVSCYEKLFMFREDLRISRHASDVEKRFRELLSPHPPRMEALLPVLGLLNWSANDTFFCAVVHSPLDKRIESMDAACIRLEIRIPNSLAMIMEEHIFLICDVSRGEQTKQEILENLTVFIRENLLKVSVSADFSDIQQLRLHYLQAQATMDVGQKNSPTQWVFQAENYILPYIYSQCTRELPATMLCPQGLLALIEYDQEKGRDYTYALKVFLECDMRIAPTIRRLYRQRQTFMYQLERIKAISGLDLDDPETKFHLLLQLSLDESWGSLTD